MASEMKSDRRKRFNPDAWRPKKVVREVEEAPEKAEEPSKAPESQQPSLKRQKSQQKPKPVMKRSGNKGGRRKR